MKRTPKQIAEEIRNLVDELVNMTSGARPLSKAAPRQAVPSATRGASGGMSILMGEGFFDQPRELSAIMTKLQEIGRHYPKNTVSMNLLNLTRRRSLVRIKDGKTKHWQYVMRK
jgi:hypothetical protein